MSVLEATKTLGRLAHCFSPNGTAKLQRCLLGGHTNHSGNLRIVESFLAIRIFGMEMLLGWREWPWVAEFRKDSRFREGGGRYCVLHEAILFACFLEFLDLWVAFASLVNIELLLKTGLGGKEGSS
jgi:hypothetical protein